MNSAFSKDGFGRSVLTGGSGTNGAAQAITMLGTISSPLQS